MSDNALIRALRSFGQGASNAVASNVSAPVDGIAWLLRKGGLPIPQNPVGGSDWMAQQGLTATPQNRLAGLLGETAGMVGPAVVQAAAPKIAGGLLALDDKAMDMARQGIERRMVNSGMIQPATVWHGSPHKFDKFDSSKIGTGEGAQAYGHGLYLAESPAVAKEYQAALGAGRGSTDADTIARLLDSVGGNSAKAAAVARQRAQYANIPGGKEKLLAMADKLEAGFDPRGNLYKVDLPDNAIARMLDWDRPLSQQAPEVSNALKSLIGDVTGGGFDLSRAPRNLRNAFSTSGIESAEQALAAKYGAKKTSTGWVDKSGRPIAQDAVDKMLAKFGGRGYENAGQLYNDLAHVAGSQSDISAALRNNGIPGIRYLDGGSRGAGQGTSNYVVFPGNEGLLQILERNGVPIK